MKENKFIKSPLNYTGGKHKLLPQILPLFPSNIDTFVDLFAGGFNVGINVEANNVIYNDINQQVSNLFMFLQSNTSEKSLRCIDDIINKYQLSKENKMGYLKLREEYNKSPSPIMLYVLICHSFSNQIRFNKNNEFNMPCGKRTFNPALRQKFNVFVNKLHKLNLAILNQDFIDVPISDKCFVYADPPYIGASAAYNEQKGWTEDDEKRFLQYLDGLDKRHIKFALSNNLKYQNPILEKWKGRYNIHYLKANYNNCNYHKKDKSKDCEVLITNY